MQARLTSTFVRKLLKAEGFPPSKPYEVRDTQLKGFVLIVRPSGVLSFCYRYRNARGKGQKYTLGKFGTITADQARKEARVISGKVSTGIDVAAEKRNTRKEEDRRRQQTLRAFFEERYQPYCVSHMQSGRSRAWVIEHYFVKEWGDKPLTDINNWLVTSWRRRKLKEGLKHGGVNRPVSALKALMARAVEWGVIESNPLQAVRPLREDKAAVIRYLTDDEEGRLRAALDGRQDRQRAERESHITWQRERYHDPAQSLAGVTFTDHIKPIVLLALNTGARRGELFSLTVDDVDLPRREMTVQGAYSKTGTTRIIPLNKEATAVLTAWLDEQAPTDLVFPSPVTGARIDNINTAWRNLMKETGIVGFRFHDLRHTFASRLVMKAVDLYTVQQLLGHSSVEMTQRYAHLAPEHKARAVNLLDDYSEE